MLKIFARKRKPTYKERAMSNYRKSLMAEENFFNMPLRRKFMRDGLSFAECKAIEEGVYYSLIAKR